MSIVTKPIVAHSERRYSVPVIHVRGSHYDIGYDVGRTFSSLIKNFIRNCDRLKHFTAEYYTDKGRDAYEMTLKNMRNRFPQYVHEIEGISDGAEVPFHKLFLLHMDDIIETINDNAIDNNGTGCSSLGVNELGTSILGHTEDAFAETLNHFYILSGHYIPTASDKAKGAEEEMFSSLCYAGHLPGYTMGTNHQNMVFTINTLSPRALCPGRTPRVFITRALLNAKSIEEVEAIVMDQGLGAANSCSINIIFNNAGKKSLYNVEMAPNKKTDESNISIRKYKENEYLLHCNRLQRLKNPEVDDGIILSSNTRVAALQKYPQPRSKDDVINMLSDQTTEEYQVFQDSPSAIVKTIAVGIFDLSENLWSLYIGRPNSSEPVAVLPIFKYNKCTRI